MTGPDDTNAPQPGRHWMKRYTADIDDLLSDYGLEDKYDLQKWLMDVVYDAWTDGYDMGRGGEEL